MGKGILICILAIGALASIALCGSYGWDQATETKDKVTQAFVYGFVAPSTLALHGLALRMWVTGWRKSATFVSFVAFFAFVMTAFTSLGGLAARSDKVLAERQTELDARADTKGQIDALAAEKAGMRFKRTTQPGVDAAQRAVDAAKLAREQECGKVGDNCRKRQDAEARAIDKLAEVQGDKASTDRAEEIDSELKRLRGIKGDGTVGAADPLKALLGKMMGTYADLLTAWQKAVFAVIYDLVLVALMIGIEAIGHTSALATRSAEMRKRPESDDISGPIGPPLAPAAKPVPELSAPLLARPKPKLAVTNRQPLGAILDFLAEGVEINEGPRTELADAFIGYQVWCRACGLRPMTVGDFVDEIEKACQQFGIRVQTEGDRHYLLDLQLAQHAAAMSEEVSS